jgi:predicted O-methyltransferase YrrM
MDMDYQTFFTRFAGSARTKNLGMVSTGLKRPFSLPTSSELPREFFRLCPWEMEYLFTVAGHVRKGIVETGRFNGGSSFVMACAAPDVPIHSIDMAPQDDVLLKELFAKTGVGQNVDLIVGDSQKTKYPQVGAVDLLFVDGDHSYEGCTNDLSNWYDNLATNGHLLVHDCYAGRAGPGDGGSDVQLAVADFLNRHAELQVIQSPFIGPFYWNYPAGSIAHLIKRAPG